MEGLFVAFGLFVGVVVTLGIGALAIGHDLRDIKRTQAAILEAVQPKEPTVDARMARLAQLETYRNELRARMGPGRQGLRQILDEKAKKESAS